MKGVQQPRKINYRHSKIKFALLQRHSNFPAGVSKMILFGVIDMNSESEFLLEQPEAPQSKSFIFFKVSDKFF